MRFYRVETALMLHINNKINSLHRLASFDPRCMPRTQLFCAARRPMMQVLHVGLSQEDTTLLHSYSQAR